VARLALPVPASGLTRSGAEWKANTGDPALPPGTRKRCHNRMRNTNIAQAALCVVIAVLAAIASAAGVFLRGDGSVLTVSSVRGVPYEVAATGVYAYNAHQVVAEGVGWDVFTLIVIVPALLLAALLVARGSFRGRLVATGLLGYLFYMYFEYSVTWAFGPLFLLHVGIAALSLGGMVWLISQLAAVAASLEPAPGFPSRAWAALALAMAGLLGLMWAGRIVEALGSESAADLMLAGGTTLTVQAIDLVLVLPTLVISSIAALRRSVVGELAAAIVVVVFVAMAAAIDAMLLSAGGINGEVQWPPILVFGGAAGAGLLIGWRMYSALAPGQTVAGRVASAPSPA
jgi:hypothetical protein